MTTKRRKLTERLKNKDYRDAYAASFLHSSIAAQIKALRESRDWKQADLGTKAGMKQSQVSRMENVNNESWSIKSLLRLAQAFDVALAVRFESFGEMAAAVDRFSKASLVRPSFPEDPAFNEATTLVLDMASTSAWTHHPVQFTIRPFSTGLFNIPSVVIQENEPPFVPFASYATIKEPAYAQETAH